VTSLRKGNFSQRLMATLLNVTFCTINPLINQKKMIFAIFLGLVLCCAKTPFAYAIHTYEVVVSGHDISLDENLTVEVKIKWPQAEGQCKLFPAEWDLVNLRYLDDSRSQESYVDDGETWTRAVIKYVFKPLSEGPASIKHFRMGYTNLKTKETATLTVVKSVDFLIKRAKKSGAVLQITIAFFVGVAVISFIVISIQVKRSALRAQREKIIRDRQTYMDIISGIEGAKGINQREIAFEWSRHFNAFLFHHYHLSKSLITEQEILEAVKLGKDIDNVEFLTVKSIYERLAEIKFSPTDLSLTKFKSLERDLLVYIKGKIVL
jgi:hypothetical protein